MKHTLRIAAALAAAALVAPALANEPQPELKEPAPAIALQGSGHAEAEALNAQSEWPGIERAAPAVSVPGLAGWADAGAILGDEPMASAARVQAAAAHLASSN